MLRFGKCRGEEPAGNSALWSNRWQHHASNVKGGLDMDIEKKIIYWLAKVMFPNIFRPLF